MRSLIFIALLCATGGALCSGHRLKIPAGSYQPFFKSDAQRGAVTVKPFWLDAQPVTRADFLRFVTARPEWRRSQVKALFAEPGYLADWHADLDPGNNMLQQPVTSVSWFAARAFCASRHARLPTVTEWERTAGGVSTERPASKSSPFAFAMGRAAADLRNTPLSFAGIWEWNADFNSATVAARDSGGSPAGLFCGDGYRAVDATNYGAFLRYSFRGSLRGNYTLKNLGFRCAGDLR
jgi:formylglycine-generating enzyme